MGGRRLDEFFLATTMLTVNHWLQVGVLGTQSDAAETCALFCMSSLVTDCEQCARVVEVLFEAESDSRHSNLEWPAPAKIYNARREYFDFSDTL